MVKSLAVWDKKSKGVALLASLPKQAVAFLPTKLDPLHLDFCLAIEW